MREREGGVEEEWRSEWEREKEGGWKQKSRREGKVGMIGLE